ncbi:MAG: metal ABC transporter substrate-binding protein [Tenericutes bacterium]|nr:metal ABC transporter substrate-binding protein [Mycoplasmatota bacterium]
MKKIFSVLLVCFLFLTGCNINDDFNDSYIYVTTYPIEYATTALYSDYAKVSSVYPNGSKSDYKVTEKKKDKYSTGEIFIYSGVSGEAYLAKDLYNRNDNIQLVDATKGMSRDLKNESMWLNPSNYLMLCSNIKSGLIEYNDNVYIKEKIENNYKTLNEMVSELDVSLYDIGKNGNYKTILTTNDVFNYLTKYNINVISLDENNKTIDKAYAEAKKLVSTKAIQYVYYLEDDTLNERQEKFISENSIVKVPIKSMFTITEEEKNNNKDYISMMNDVIDNYKKELYKK